MIFHILRTPLPILCILHAIRNNVCSGICPGGTYAEKTWKSESSVLVDSPEKYGHALNICNHC